MGCMGRRPACCPNCRAASGQSVAHTRAPDSPSLAACMPSKADGRSRSYASFDPSQVGRGRLSAVQYLLFDLPVGAFDAGPVRVGCDFPALTLAVDLDDAQRAALAADLAATRG